MSALYNFYRPMQQELNSLKPAFWHGKSEQSSLNIDSINGSNGSNGSYDGFSGCRSCVGDV
jgi:hypothetical protein